MYFTNLTNEELQLYHKITSLDSVSLDLTLMQESSLFNVNNLGNNIYKIIPLFYVDEITCNEDNVKILDNKCIILQEQTNPTFINFITNNETNSSYIWDDTYRKDSATPLPLIDPSDDITMPQFNNLIQVLRDNVPFYDDIKIKNGVINGLYGDYTFNITDATILDNGILISEETIANDLTVRLNNPQFEYSTYTLTLDVVSIEDINLLDDYNSDNITHTSLDVTLTPNEAVTISLSELEFNTVIDFDARVKIEHNKPYLTFNSHLKLELTTSGKAYDPVTLKATYDEGGTVVSSETITFYNGETVIGTATTDNDGIATINYYAPQPNQYYNFVAKSSEVTSETKQVYLQLDTLRIINASVYSLDSNCPNTTPTTVRLTGQVTRWDETPVGVASEVTCIYYRNNQQIETITVTTDSNGYFTNDLAITEDNAQYGFQAYAEPIQRDNVTLLDGNYGDRAYITFHSKKPTNIIATLIDDDSGHLRVKGYLEEDPTVTHFGIPYKTLKVMYTDGVQTYIKSVVTEESGFYYAGAYTGFNTTSITVIFDGDCEYQGSTQIATRS